MATHVNSVSTLNEEENDAVIALVERLDDLHTGYLVSVDAAAVNNRTASHRRVREFITDLQTTVNDIEGQLVKSVQRVGQS